MQSFPVITGVDPPPDYRQVGFPAWVDSVASGEGSVVLAADGPEAEELAEDFK